MRCQSCGASPEVNIHEKWATCEYCGTRFIVDGELSHAHASEGAEPRVDDSPAKRAAGIDETRTEGAGRQAPNEGAPAGVRPGEGNALDSRAKRILVIGGVLLALSCMAYGTSLGLRVLGLSVQEWCMIVYATMLVGFYRRCNSKTARKLVVAYWVLAALVLVLQIVAWINGGPFALPALP